MKNIKMNTVPKAQTVDILLSEINVPEYQPIKANAASIDALTDDIHRNGLVCPLVVTIDKKGYLLIDGADRIKAIKRLGYDSAPCVII